MLSVIPKTTSIVRPLQYRDWEAVERLLSAEGQGQAAERSWLAEPLRRSLQPWNRHPLLKVVDALPLSISSPLRTYVLEDQGTLQGVIQVSPFNRARSTWRVERVCQAVGTQAFEVGTQLLRYCLEHIWEARTWMVEVEINHRDALGLYRHNGFQPMAQLTRWQLSPATLTALAEHQPVLPNLLPVNNADSTLLYQLDTAAMPPFVRQVFDRHVQDFQRHVIGQLVWSVQTALQRADWLNGYVFEPQRKAAIGYFAVCLCREGRRTHQAQLTVHPAYTWLYPELFSHIAHLVASVSKEAPLELISADYQPEREDFLRQLGVEEVEHTLMLSRSVWHKVREAKSLSLETRQLVDMLQGLQPNHTPAPGRFSFLQTWRSPLEQSVQPSRNSFIQGGFDAETNGSPVRPKPVSSNAPDPHGSCG